MPLLSDIHRVTCSHITFRTGGEPDVEISYTNSPFSPFYLQKRIREVRDWTDLLIWTTTTQVFFEFYTAIHSSQMRVPNDLVNL